MKKNSQLFRDDLYCVTHWESNDVASLHATVVFNAGHRIYEVHFPGNPITPGACVVQIATELLSQHLSKDMILTRAKNIKFINLINPLENAEVDFIFKITANDDGSVNSSINVCRNSHSFVKISATFREYNDAE